MKLIFAVFFLSVLFGCSGQHQKPPEAVHIAPPTSVSTEISKEQAIVVSLTKEGKVFLLLGDSVRNDAIINNLNRERGLNLSDTQLARLKRMDVIGLPLNKLKSALDLQNPMPASEMGGIPISDSNHNELVYWIRAAAEAFKDELDNLNLLVKGDNLAKYPAFKAIKQAFKKNGIYKFKIITNPE